MSVEEIELFHLPAVIKTCLFSNCLKSFRQLADRAVRPHRGSFLQQYCAMWRNAYRRVGSLQLWWKPSSWSGRSCFTRRWERSRNCCKLLVSCIDDPFSLIYFYFHTSTVETLRQLILQDLQEDGWSHDSDNTPTNETVNERSSAERQRPESLETVLSLCTNEWESEPEHIPPSDAEKPNIQVVRKGNKSNSFVFLCSSSVPQHGLQYALSSFSYQTTLRCNFQPNMKFKATANSN